MPAQKKTDKVLKEKSFYQPGSVEQSIGRAVPHNNDAERGLLAACFLDATGTDVLNLCHEQKITPECFFNPAHQIIFQVIQELASDNKPAEIISVIDLLKKKDLLESVGGIPYISQVASAIETTAHAPYWIEIIREKYVYRKLIEVSTRTIEGCYEQNDSVDNFIEVVEKQILEINQDRVSDSSQAISTSIDKAMMIIDKMAKQEGTDGLSSGFKDLDGMTYGFHGSEMIVLAARPSVGKTSLAMNFVEHAAMPKRGPAIPVLVFSLEMGADQLAMRLIWSVSRVDHKKVRDGFVSNDEKRRIIDAAKQIKEAPIFIDDSGQITILQLRAKARRVHREHKVGLIVIDYLQLISGTDSRIAREQQISEISRGIKSLAKELNVPIIVLSQLNRESEKESRDPRLSDLRESGSIEQDADVVFLLHRPRKGKAKEEKDSHFTDEVEKIELIIAKQRNGPVGVVPLSFIRRFTRYENFMPEHSIS